MTNSKQNSDQNQKPLNVGQWGLAPLIKQYEDEIISTLFYLEQSRKDKSAKIRKFDHTFMDIPTKERVVNNFANIKLKYGWENDNNPQNVDTVAFKACFISKINNSQYGEVTLDLYRWAMNRTPIFAMNEQDIYVGLFNANNSHFRYENDRIKCCISLRYFYKIRKDLNDDSVFLLDMLENTNSKIKASMEIPRLHVTGNFNRKVNNQIIVDNNAQISFDPRAKKLITLYESPMDGGGQIMSIDRAAEKLHKLYNEDEKKIKTKIERAIYSSAETDMAEPVVFINNVAKAWVSLKAVDYDKKRDTYSYAYENRIKDKYKDRYKDENGESIYKNKYKDRYKDENGKNKYAGKVKIKNWVKINLYSNKKYPKKWTEEEIKYAEEFKQKILNSAK